MTPQPPPTRPRPPVIIVSAPPARSAKQYLVSTLRTVDSTAGAFFAFVVGFALLGLGGAVVFNARHHPVFPYIFSIWLVLCCMEGIGLLWIKREIEAECFPLAPHLAVEQWHWPVPLRPFVSLWWLAHFFLAAAVAVCLDLLFRHQPIAWWWHAGMYAFGFSATYSANLYLLLAVSAFTRSPTLHQAIWRSRLAIDFVVIGMAWAWPTRV